MGKETVGQTAICLLLISTLFAKTHPTHFGIRVRPKVEKLWTQVEELYKHRIIEERSAIGSEYGEASISTEGFPTIQLAVDGISEDTIVHELLHLEFIANGYPICGWFIDKQYPLTPQLNLVATWLIHNLRDSIQHWEFYPEFERVGITPDQSTASEFKAFAKSGKFPLLEPTYLATTVAYLRLLLLPDNSASQSLKRTVAKVYVHNGWERSKTTAEQMQAYIFLKSPHSPESEIDCFVHCANLVVGELGSYSVSVVRWQVLQIGVFQERAVVLSLDRLRK